jgi:hypothetical protein
MSLTKSIVEDAALILPAASLTLPLPAGEVKRENIRRLNPAIPEEALAVIWNFRITRFDRSLR